MSELSELKPAVYHVIGYYSVSQASGIIASYMLYGWL